MEISMNCIETFVGVPTAFVKGGLAEYFKSYGSMIWHMMNG